MLFLDVLFEFEFSICCSGVQMIVLPNLQNKALGTGLRLCVAGLGKVVRDWEKNFSPEAHSKTETCFKMRYPEMVWYYNEAFQEYF